jgi:hypothetical protein
MRRVRGGFVKRSLPATTKSRDQGRIDAPKIPRSSESSFVRRGKGEALRARPVHALSRSLRNAWTIEHGRAPPAPFADGRSPDGAPRPRRYNLADKIPISWVMADLHRRDLPPLVPGTAGDLVRAMKLDPEGEIARYLVHFDKLTHLLKNPDEPFGVATRFALAEILSRAADEEGRLDLRGYFEAHPEQQAELTKVVRYIGRQPVGPRLKQYGDAPYDMLILDTSLAWLLAPFGEGPREGQLFTDLKDAVFREQSQRMKEAMPLLDEVAAREGPARPGDVVWRREHILGSNSTDHAAPRIARAGKLYSTSVPVMVHLGMSKGQIGWPLAMTVIADADKDSVIDHEAMGASTYRGTKEALLKSLVWGGLKMGEEEPIDRFVAVDSGATALLALDDAIKKGDLFEPGWLRMSGGPIGLDYGRKFKDEAPPFFGFRSREEFLRCVSAVEHTHDGSRQLRWRIERDGRLSFKVVNAADSPVKLNMVALLCAWSVVEELMRTLADLEAQGFAFEKKVMVAGYGSTGPRVARLLRLLGYEVIVKEDDRWSQHLPPEERPSAVARREGFEVVSRVPEGCEANIVLGCVGEPSFTDEEIRCFKSGTLFASASSSNKEFPFKKSCGWSLKETTRARPIVEFLGKPLVTGIGGYDLTHHHRVVTSGDKEMLVANSGYALDMTGGPDPLSPVLAQLIRALMLQATFEARKLPHDGPDLVPLGREGQRFIANRFMEMIDALDPPLPRLLKDLLDEEYRRTLEELDRPPRDASS